ncbi:phenylpyruvate tautomerase MIF-related protein [uncultured Cloacibacillus sp.]|uniref:phenylpyruvate tautomerase MIF-related protein n=1 Tax=uncultured Cloacibacillus sp. TaxID=889794 RepID=UPI002588E388|nr:phenylpyruvate tautomerase MIF-related protein [uncultured Cloacibacillus sp.]
MPCVQIQTNVAYNESDRETILREATKAMVEQAHKNEEAVMVILQKVDGMMGNSSEPMALIDVRSMVGIEHKTNNDISAALTPIMTRVLGVSPYRTYITFLRIPETCWGLMGGIATWQAKTRLWVVNDEPCK